MLLFLKSLSVWDWMDVVGLLMVLAGVVGEVWSNKRHNQIWENRWGYILIVGLGLELFALPHHFIEAGELRNLASEANERSKQLESTNLWLRLEIAKLDPRSRPIASISASARILLRLYTLPGEIDKTPLTKADAETSAQLKVSIKRNLPVGVDGKNESLELVSDGLKILRSGYSSGGMGDPAELTAQFRPMTLFFTDPIRRTASRQSPIGMPVSLIDNIDGFSMTFLDRQLEGELSGSVTITFNESSRTFSIPMQPFTNTIVVGRLAITNPAGISPK